MLSKEKLDNIRKAIAISILPSSQHKVSYYDEITGGTSGSREKQFVRSDSGIFQPLFDELQNNPDCSYVTHANRIVKDGFCPKKLSTIIKYQGESRTDDEITSLDLIMKELLGGQILNYYGVNTCYNLATKDELLNDYQIVSVDFVPFGSEFVTFDELNYILGQDMDRDMYYQLPELYKCSELKDVDNKEIDNICEQYIYSYLVRRLILKDIDFSHTNCGFIKHENNKVDFINFDYEFCFDPTSFVWDVYDNHDAERELLRVKRSYPNVYKKFVKKTRELCEGLAIINSEIESLPQEHKKYIQQLKTTSQQVLDIINTHKKSM